MKKLMVALSLLVGGVTAQADTVGYTCSLTDVVLAGQSTAFVLSVTELSGTGVLNCYAGTELRNGRVTNYVWQLPVNLNYSARGIGLIFGRANAEQVLAKAAVGLSVGNNKNDVFGTYNGAEVGAVAGAPRGTISLRLSKSNAIATVGGDLQLSLLTRGLMFGADIRGVQFTISPADRTWKGVPR